MTDFLHILKIELDLLVLKDYLSGLLLIRCGVPQSPILGLLLFRIYKHYLHYAIKHCKVCHFADETKPLNFNHSITKLNKQNNYDLKNRLNANKICLNVSKTGFVYFKSLKNKQICTLN